MTSAPTLEHHQQVLRDAVAMAVMAPSSHNTQPWRFRIIGPTLEVLADPTRHLSVIDHERRQLIQSCGCALFNARVALRMLGFKDEVTVMLADQDHELLATLHLGPMHVATADDRKLFEAIPRRRTNRRPFLDRPIAATTADGLIAAAEQEGAWMVRLDPSQKRTLGNLVDEADRQQFESAEFRAELGKWLRPFGSRQRDGIPFVEKEYGSGLPFTVMRALRSPDLGEQFGEIENQLVRGSPLVAVLGTERDEPTDWLACGQALQAVLLRATELGMSAGFLNQVLEVPALRAKVVELIGGGTPHMILRLGYPSEPLHKSAPRRDLSDVLEIVS